LGVRSPNPKLQSLLSQEQVKVWTVNLADTFSVYPKKGHQNVGEKEEWAYPEIAQIF